MKVTAKQIKEANAAGIKHLNSDGPWWCYHTVVLDVAYNLGRNDGLSLADAPVVTGTRFGGMPLHGISRNHADDTAERGCSLAGIGDDLRWGQMSYAMGREPLHVTGILVPDTGSDGEPLVLPVNCLDYLD